MASDSERIGKKTLKEWHAWIRDRRDMYLDTITLPVTALREILARAFSRPSERAEVWKEAMEAAAKVAERPYSDDVEAYGDDSPLTVGRKIAAAIRTLPAPPALIENAEEKP